MIYCSSKRLQEKTNRTVVLAWSTPRQKFREVACSLKYTCIHTHTPKTASSPSVVILRKVDIPNNPKPLERSTEFFRPASNSNNRYLSTLPRVRSQHRQNKVTCNQAECFEPKGYHDSVPCVFHSLLHRHRILFSEGFFLGLRIPSSEDCSMVDCTFS